MKIHSIEQPLKCSQCRTLSPIRTCKRSMNFTTGEIIFYCHRCRIKIGFLPFARWNALYRDYFENPRPPERERPPEAREGQRRRRWRGRTPRRDRPDNRPPRPNPQRS